MSHGARGSTRAPLFNRRTFAEAQRFQAPRALPTVDDERLSRVPTRLAKPRP